ncbi:Rv2175c family DNA-binding protein [Saccharopolyspora rosea]
MGSPDKIVSVADVNPSGAKRGAPSCGIVCSVSAIPAAPDVLAPDVEVIPLPDVAERLGQPVTRVHQLIRDGHLLAVRREGVLGVPTAFLTATAVVKGLPGTITLLKDAGYHDDEILRWLFTADDTLPGTPIEALRGDRGREVKRRAQAMGF